jgi:hypothetical protein
VTGTLTPAGEALQVARREAHAEIMAQPGKDLADLSEVEFKRGLERIRLVQERMEKILATALQEGKHYSNFGGAFKQKLLVKAGAEEVRRLMRVRVRRLAAPDVLATEDWVSVTVHLGVYDEMGRLIAERSANCNTKEARFYNQKSSKWTYTDAREMVHQCLAMADKRASVDLTEEASGATGYFATAEALSAGIEEGAAIAGCSGEDKIRIKEAALAKKMTKGILFATMIGATGRDMADGEVEPFVAENEVQMVLDAIAEWAPARKVEAEEVRTSAPPLDFGDVEDLP